MRVALVSLYLRATIVVVECIVKARTCFPHLQGEDLRSSENGPKEPPVLVWLSSMALSGGVELCAVRNLRRMCLKDSATSHDSEIEFALVMLEQ